MTNKLFNSTVYLLVIILISSCSVSNIAIKKRRYQKGWYVSTCGHHEDHKANNTRTILEKKNESSKPDIKTEIDDDEEIIEKDIKLLSVQKQPKKKIKAKVNSFANLKSSKEDVKKKEEYREEKDSGDKKLADKYSNASFLFGLLVVIPALVFILLAFIPGFPITAFLLYLCFFIWPGISGIMALIMASLAKKYSSDKKLNKKNKWKVLIGKFIGNLALLYLLIGLFILWLSSQPGAYD